MSLQNTKLRERTRGSPLTSPGVNTYYSQWATCAQSTETPTGTYQLPVVGKHETMWDHVHKNFHRRRAKGEVFFSSMSQSIVEVSFDEGVGAKVHYNGTQVCGGVTRPSQIVRADYWEGPDQYAADLGPMTHPVYIEPLYLFSAEEINDLLIEHETKVLSNRGRSDTDLFESLAQADKSLFVLSDLFKSLRKAVRPGSLVQRGQSLASAWLITRYGIKPLIGDIVGVLEGLMETKGRVRKSTRSKAPLLTTSLEARPIDSIIYQHSILAKHEDNVSIRVGSLDEVDVSMLFNIGFSPKSLITLPWELIPYSFVVDWFSNVGDFIGSLVPDFGIKQLGTYTTVQRYRRMVLTQGPCVAAPGWIIDTVPNGEYTTTVQTKIRSVYPLRRRLLIKNDFKFHNRERALDALSLLIQKIRR